jgi:hypothetical protein
MGEHPTAGRTDFDRGQRFFQINATCLVKKQGLAHDKSVSGGQSLIDKLNVLALTVTESHMHDILAHGLENR